MPISTRPFFTPRIVILIVRSNASNPPTTIDWSLFLDKTSMIKPCPNWWILLNPKIVCANHLNRIMNKKTDEEEHPKVSFIVGLLFIESPGSYRNILHLVFPTNSMWHQNATAPCRVIQVTNRTKRATKLDFQQWFLFKVMALAGNPTQIGVDSFAAKRQQTQLVFLLYSSDPSLVNSSLLRRD